MIEPELSRRRRGQTLAEFAITLPILLLLLFGIIEFGRIFQAWVTLQNSARAAARYATTGQYDDDSYTLDLTFVPISGAIGDLNSMVPCLRNDDARDLNDDGIMDNEEPTQAQIDAADAYNRSQRGVLTDVYPNDSGDPRDKIEVYVGGPESLYATWYSGDDCDPNDNEDQNRRKDMARILSIYWEARRGAAGLALGDQLPVEPPNSLVPYGITDNPTTWYDGTVDAVGNDAARFYPVFDEMPWYEVWKRPLPGDEDSNAATPQVYEQLENSDEPGWFSMMICSSRPKLDDSNSPSPGFVDFRFDTRLYGGGLAPACVLNETPTVGGNLDTYGWTFNSADGTDTNSTTWLDAGGPGDTISIVITFNHPLVTPLGLAAFLPLQARRTAVNEAFRAPRSNPIPYRLPDSSGGVRTDTPTNTNTVTNTATSTNTPTASVTPSPTYTDTPEFTCASVTLPASVSYLNDQVRFTLTNSLPYPITLKRVVLVWRASAGYEGLMNVGVMYLGAAGSTIWSGADTTSSTDVGNAVTVGSGTPVPAATPEFPFATSANLLLAPGANIFGVRFLSGPVALNSTNMPGYTFSGTTFYVDDPSPGNNDCASTLNFGAATDTPVPTAGNSPTWTNTPECLTGQIEISAAAFESFGIVRFDFTNRRAVPVTLVGFNIRWQSYGAGQMLYDVYGGNVPPRSAGSILVWEGATGQDVTSPTSGYRAGLTPPTGLVREGTWGSTDLTIAPSASRSVYLEFRGGIGDGSQPVSTAFPGMWYNDFNGTVFYFDTPLCNGIFNGTPGTPGLGTGTPEEVTPSTLVPSATPTFTQSMTGTNTRTPTNTATRTNTSTPTQTASRTNTNTATNTATRTFTATFTRSNTPTSTATFTRSNTPTNTSTFTPTFTRSNTPTFTPTFTATNTRTFTATFTRSNTPTSTRTFTATFTRSNTPTFTATFTRSNTPTSTRTFTATNTRTFTATFTRSNTPTSTPTFTATFTRSNTPTNTATFTATNTRTFTATFTRSNTPTNTRTFTPTFTATFTRSNTPTFTPTFTFTPSRTPTSTLTPTRTSSPTASNTVPPTNTNTRTPTPTSTITPTPDDGGGGST